jgi:hypothetical protein
MSPERFVKGESERTTCFNCPYTANLPESSLKMDRFGPGWTPLDPIGPQRFAGETGHLFNGLLSMGLG